MWSLENTVRVVKRKRVMADVVVIRKEEDMVWVRSIKYKAKVAAIGNDTVYTYVQIHVYIQASVYYA